MAPISNAAHANLWHVTCKESLSTTPLSDDLTVDLAIIGGGFTGCAAALEAARSGASVCLLEGETLGHGGSGRNVGLVNAGLWLPPDDITAALGETQGRRLIDALGAGPQAVFDLISREGLSCEATRNGTLHLAHSAKGLRDLQNRMRQGNRFGAPLRLLDATDTVARTGSDLYHGALFDPRAGTVQPLSYCRGLARAAQSAGAQIFDQSPVRRLSHTAGVWRLETAHGTLRAAAVLLATNAYFKGLSAPYTPQYIPVFYSQFATAPLPAPLQDQILRGGEGCWDTAMVMTSFRLDHAGRLIVGSLGNAEGAGGAIHANWARRKLAQIFPALKNVAFEHSWRGKIAMTSDHIPKIVSFGPKALAIFGYSGRGISPGTVFGTSAARALCHDEVDSLPLIPQSGHTEWFKGLRGTYYEFGATLTHAVLPTARLR